MSEPAYPYRSRTVVASRAKRRVRGPLVLAGTVLFTTLTFAFVLRLGETLSR